MGKKINRQKYLNLNAVARSFGIVARRISTAVMCSNETLIDICICRLFITSWKDVDSIWPPEHWTRNMKYYNTIWPYNLTGEISLVNSTQTHNIDDNRDNHDSNSYNIKTTMMMIKIIFFWEGMITNRAIWLVLSAVRIFLSLPKGNGNAFMSRRVSPYLRCHFHKKNLSFFRLGSIFSRDVGHYLKKKKCYSPA